MEFYKVWRKTFTTVKKNQNQTMTIFLAVLIISMMFHYVCGYMLDSLCILAILVYFLGE